MPPTYSNIQVSELRCEMQGGVAMILDVGVPQIVGVVLDDAFEEGEIAEVDGASDSVGRVNPGGRRIRRLD